MTRQALELKVSPSYFSLHENLNLKLRFETLTLFPFPAPRLSFSSKYSANSA